MAQTGSVNGIPRSALFELTSRENDPIDHCTPLLVLSAVSQCCLGAKLWFNTYVLMEGDTQRAYLQKTGLKIHIEGSLEDQNSRICYRD